MHWLSEPTTWFRILEKEICFHKIHVGPIMLPKRIRYKISTIFLFACVRDKMTKTGTADLMKWASKIYFLDKYPNVYIRGTNDHILTKTGRTRVHLRKKYGHEYFYEKSTASVERYLGGIFFAIMCVCVSVKQLFRH